MSVRPRDRVRIPRRQVRHAVANEAARLMYREGVGQYFDAKRMAARRVLGREGTGSRLRYQDLPSNGEIRDALLILARLAEGEDRGRRLFAMRAVALDVMDALDPFHPRLIGSVWSGHVRVGSDIDVHVFTDDEDRLDAHLDALGWATREERVEIQVGDVQRSFRHVHVLDQPYPVELSVYGLDERRVVTRSSTDGRPIDRVSPARLRDRLASEHPDLWAGYQGTGVLDVEDRALPPDEFAGLLEELADGTEEPPSPRRTR